ncbi:MAG TPA: type II toxin-antitoxin system VapC family toxin [Chloroflexota bacterium]
MSLQLLDSDVVIDFLKGVERAVRLLRSLRAAQHDLATMPVIVAEVFVGTPPEGRGYVRLLFDSFVRLPLSDQAAQRAGELGYDHARRGIQLTTPDLLIAATALEHGATLVTRNIRDYPIAGLSILSPY